MGSHATMSEIGRAGPVRQQRAQGQMIQNPMQRAALSPVGPVPLNVQMLQGRADQSLQVARLAQLRDLLNAPGATDGRAVQRQNLHHDAASKTAAGTVQREITVNGSELDIARLRRDYGRGISANVRNAVKLADDADTVSPDVPALIDQMLVLIRGNDKPGLNFTAQERDRLATAFGAQLSNFDPDTKQGRSHAAVFEQLIEISGAGASRSKGTASTLGAANVPGTANLSANVTAAQATITALLAGLTAANFWTNVGPLIAGQQIRTGYQNGGGWLPAVAMPAAPTPLQTEWYGYTGDTSTYVEFTVDDSWRIVYNFIDGSQYLTLHYDWHQGYNPFFTL